MRLRDVPTVLRAYLGARWRFRRLRGDALVRYQDRAAVEHLLEGLGLRR